MRLRAAFILSAMVTACAPPPQGYQGGATYSSSASQPAVQTTVAVNDSQFEPRIRFNGIESVVNNGVFLTTGDNRRTFFIRSWMDKQTHRVEHQLYWSIIYRDYGWRTYNRINDEQARPLRFTSIDRTVVTCTGAGRSGICSYAEVVGGELDDAVLRTAAREGRQYCVKIFARDGTDSLACLTSQMIRAQIEAIDARRPAQRPAPAATPAASPQPRRAPPTTPATPSTTAPAPAPAVTPPSPTAPVTGT